MKIHVRFKRNFFVLFHDIAWVAFSIFLAFWFRFNLGLMPPDQLKSVLEVIAIAIPIHTAMYWFFGCHLGIWQFFSTPDLVRLLKAVVVGSLLVVASLVLYYRFGGVPRTVAVLYPILLVLGVSGSRIAYRLVKAHTFMPEHSERESALVVGAGCAGDLLIRDLLDHGSFIPVAIIDDDIKKQGTDLHGVRVIGKVANLSEIIGSYDVQVVLIAMPSASRIVMDEIVRICADMQIPCRTLPSLLELADGRVEISRLRPVTLEDLLGRETIKLDQKAISEYIAGKCVAVTGGGGSIGSELCRQVLAHGPSILLVIDSSEFNLYSIDLELKSKFPDRRIIPLLADIRVNDSIEKIFAFHNPQVVFHAAAYKHVPMVEENIVEGVRNNVFGTKIVADAAVRYGVSKFVQVSTDKTVNPTSLMGATKRVAEIYCQELSAESDTHFVTTRFGNVLGSAGSVVPLFERQIKQGGPLTITHPDVTRYFMTIPEAASLILQAGSMGQGGEIYVLDMGEPIKIVDLAEDMIRLCGFEPEVDIDLEFIGLRPGEKLHEELFYKKEELQGTGHSKLMLANCMAIQCDSVQAQIKTLQNAVTANDEGAVLHAIQQIVPEFNCSKSINKAEVVRLVPKQDRA